VAAVREPVAAEERPAPVAAPFSSNTP